MTALLAALLAAAPVSVDYHGTLGEALSTIAKAGGINLIATGDLNEAAEVHLKDVTAEEALKAVAELYHLELAQQGKLWIVKPQAATPLAVPVPPIPPVPPARPLPPTPPTPPSPDAIDAEADAAEQRAEALRDEAERQRDAADAEAEKLEELREKAEEHLSSQRVSAGNIKVADGEHVRDVVTYGGTVTVGNGVIADGSIVAIGGDVTLGDGDIINGDAVSFGGTVRKGHGTIVKGEEVSLGAKSLGVTALPALKPSKSTPPRAESKDEHSGGGLAAFLINFATFFGLGFLLMMFVPTRMRNIEAEILNEPVKSGLAGMLAMLASLPLTLFLFLTVIGIPVALVGWVLAGLCVVMGLLAVANTLGSRIPIRRFKRTQALVLAVGLLVMMLISMVPVVGPVLLFSALCVSFGAIIRTRAGQRALAGVPIPDDKFIAP